jgi:beta-1,4-mannosyl-glycoprotein beta-1,4-N-acetylglucosaminyltransferase
MKIIDTFLFYNEEKMLDFRLNYYKDVVDYFVIVEATKTFSGFDKPLYFEAIKHKYSHIKNIIHVVVRDMPEHLTITFDNTQQIPQSVNWQREYYQRNYIKEALKQVPDISDEDWIVIADVDEFPNRDKLTTVQLSNDYFSSPDKIGYTLEFDMYYYNITSKLDNKWYKCKLLRYHVVKTNDLNVVRDATYYPLLIEFGWHFSYFFSPEMIKFKIQAFSHQEYNEDKFTNKDYLEDCIKNGKSLFHLDGSRTEKIIYTPTETNSNLPEGYKELI